MKTTYHVTGMHCASCENKVREALESAPGVQHVVVSLAEEEAEVQSDDQPSLESLNQRVSAVGGYHLDPHNESTSPAAEMAAGVEHEPDQSRFVYRREGRESTLSYDRPDDDVINLLHTFVPPDDRNQGIAAKLAESALNYAEQQTLRVAPTCSYVRRYIEQHPRRQSLINGSTSKDETGQPETGRQEQAGRSWLATYQPLLLIVAYLAGGVLIAGAATGVWRAHFLMSVFMGLFFVVFSFFKMLDLRGFAQAYTSYDLVAARWLPYAYLYPFIELALGVGYLLQVWPVAVSAVTLVVMTVGAIGVINAVARGRDIQCGCLGTMFDLPMSTVTIVEDVSMAAMAAAMLVMQAA